MEDDWTNKKVKVSLKSGRYYKGKVLSSGEEYIRIRDINDNLVYVRLDAVDVIEEWRG